MKVGIVGSRNYPDLSQVREYVKQLPEGTIVVSGGAKGVDTVAEMAARSRGLEVIIFPADWQQFGKSAGMKRNVTIVETSDRVVAFWDGISAGTAHSIRIAKEMGKEVTVFQ